MTDKKHSTTSRTDRPTPHEPGHGKAVMPGSMTAKCKTIFTKLVMAIESL